MGNRTKVFILILLYLLYMNIFNVFYISNIENDKFYNMSIIFNKNYAIVEKIDGKNLDKKIYLKNYDEIKNGKYKVLAKVNSVKNKNIEIKILDYNEDFTNKYRNYLFDIVDKNYEKRGINSFIKAILLGNKDELYKSDISMYKYIGISHIFSISGLHLTILLIFVRKILNLLIKNINLETVIEFLFITLYSYIVGFSISIKRVYVMYLIKKGNKFLNFNFDKEEVYIISLILLAGYNINNIFDFGLIMTFSSTFVIFFLIDELQKIDSSYIYLLPLLIQIFSLPFMYYYTKSVPILSFVANMIIIPIISIFVELIFIDLIFNILGIGILNYVAEFIYNGFYNLILFLSKIEYMSINIEKPNILIFILLILIDVLLVVVIFKIRENRVFR